MSGRGKKCYKKGEAAAIYWEAVKLADLLAVRAIVELNLRKWNQKAQYDIRTSSRHFPGYWYTGHIDTTHHLLQKFTFMPKSVPAAKCLLFHDKKNDFFSFRPPKRINR